MRNEYKMVCKTPCYVDPCNASTENPYRLYIALADNGEIWLHAEGNGCGDDMLLPDDDEIWDRMDTDAMLDNAKELRAAGFEDAADWVESKAEEIAG